LNLKFLKEALTFTRNGGGLRDCACIF
jgi:hypothetical protein